MCCDVLEGAEINLFIIHSCITLLMQFAMQKLINIWTKLYTSILFLNVSKREWKAI